MTLNELIQELEKQDPDKAVRRGLILGNTRPPLPRDCYFLLGGPTTVFEMLTTAKRARWGFPGDSRVVYGNFKHSLKDLAPSDLRDILSRNEEAPATRTYEIDQDQFDRLEEVAEALQGVGTSLTPDSRRDLANRLILLLREIRSTK